ncbi:MAG: glycosyltransferase, partial [Gammaproteobacteria bacterium]
MQRVVWINKSNWRKPGPIVYMGLLNAMAFAEHGIATDYFVGYGDESDTEQDLREFYGVAPSPFLQIHRIKEISSGSRDVYKEAVSKINEYLKEGDQVMALTRELGALSRLLKLKKKSAGLRVVYESHDYYLTRAHLPKQNLSGLRRQWSERLLIPQADGLLCLTEHQRALYQQQLTRLPIVAAPLGCLSFPEQDAEHRRLKRHVAYIGHLHGYKGSELIFEIARKLKEKNVRLSCYGGHDPQVRKLRSQAKQQGVDDVLSFEHFVSPAELHRILEHDVSIGLVPLQDTFYSRYLTCPVKALDFLSHGLPIVASDLPSNCDLLKMAGIFCSSCEALG